MVLVGTGLGLTYLAVRGGAKLGTAAAPFLGRYDFTFAPRSLLAPLVALVAIIAAWKLLNRLPWWQIVTLSYFTTLAWTYSLALVNGTVGPTWALAGVTDTARAGTPPGLTTLIDGMGDLGLTYRAVSMTLTALGTLTVPLVLIAVRGSCGDAAARALTPLVVLAPYALWMAGSTDGIVAVLGAAGVVLGERASKHVRTGLPAVALAMAAGITIGVAALFSYAVAWLGLSVVCLYFARRRPLLHLASGLGALIPVLVAALVGFSWFDGLLAARHDLTTRIEPHRSVLWWSVLSLVPLLLAAGPGLIASMRKIRNTPGWPFMMGAAVAVLFSALTGFAHGGVEHAWVPFFPWLLTAASAPERPGGEAVRTPLVLTAVGAVSAIVIATILVPSW
ncbi:MAG: hypothetical protein H0T78_10495 [Longispora sp.]|nr:hypothetical protein [Longispora sp. (in: high G+C Gram-positive bacteria)]